MKGLIIILGILKVQTCMALWSCAVDIDCSSLVGSVCASGSCVCPSGTESVNGGTLCADIAPYYAAPCHDDYQCARLFTSYECKMTENTQEGNCNCKPGSHYFRGRCWLSIEHGQTCSRDEECQGLPDPFSMSCKSGACDCADGYYLRQRGECRKAAGLNEQCVVNEDCTFAGGVCDSSTLRCIDQNASETTKISSTVVPLKNHKMAGNNKMADLREYGVICDGANSCTAPFECYAGLCVCPIGYYSEGNSTECFAELGSPSSPEQCVGFLAEVQDGVCTCPSNFYYSDNMRDCTKMSRVITDFCMSDKACLTFGGSASCQEPGEWGLRNCVCDPEVSVWDGNRNLCRYFADVGEYCEVDSDCYVEGLDVWCAQGENGGYCACPDGYVPIDGMCLTTGLVLGDTCRASQECTGVSNAECVDGICSCAAGFSEHNNECAPAIGGVCSLDSDCIIDNTVCVTADSTATCQCHQNFIEYNDDCWAAIDSQHETCLISAQCWNILGSNSICDNGTCVCPTGYHLKDGNCWQSKGVFESCSRSSECFLQAGVDQLVCRNSICQCDFQYPYSEELRTCTSAANLLRSSLAALIISLVYLFL